MLLLFQKFDRIGRSPLDGNAIAADVDPRIQMGAATAIENPPAPSDTTGTGILPVFVHGIFVALPFRGCEPSP